MIEIVKLEEVTPTASGVSARTGNPWQKTEIVVVTTGEWPKRFRLTCFNDVCAKALAIAPGTMVQVRFSIEQREVPAKGDRAAFWVNEVSCHGITPYVQQPLQAQYTPAQQQQPYAQPMPSTGPHVPPTGTAPQQPVAQNVAQLPPQPAPAPQQQFTQMPVQGRLDIGGAGTYRDGFPY